MQLSNEALRTALRVLTAITDYQDPDIADVEWLRRSAPLLAHEPIDELACNIIRQALQRRAALQQTAG